MEVSLIFIVYLVGFILGCFVTWNIMKKSPEKKELPEPVAEAPEPPKPKKWHKVTLTLKDGDIVKGYIQLTDFSSFHFYLHNIYARSTIGLLTEPNKAAKGCILLNSSDIHVSELELID